MDCTEMGDFFQDRPGYLARADLQKCSGSHKSRFAFICHCFCLGYLLVLVTVYQPMEMKQVGVQKLLGFQDRAVFFDVVKQPLPPPGGSCDQSSVFFLLDYKPRFVSYAVVVFFCCCSFISLSVG